MTYEEIHLSGLPCLNKWFVMKNPTGNMVSSVGLRLCLVGLIWRDLVFKKMGLRGWRLFGWTDLEGWM